MPFFAPSARVQAPSAYTPEARIAELEAVNAGLQQKLMRSFTVIDRTTEAAHRTEAHLIEALATNRDSVAYAQQLEAELRLRTGYAPSIERSAPPDAYRSDASQAPNVSATSAWSSAGSVAPELPDTTLTPTVITQFVEVESADSKRVRARLVRKTWDEVVQRAVIGECKGRTATRFDACAASIEGKLAPFQAKASQCMAGNFGGTFYLEDGNRLSTPSNGVSLDRGIVVFCDPNLKDGAVKDDHG